LYTIIQKIWEKHLIVLKPHHRMFELVLNIIPLFLLCTALSVDIFFYQQINLFYHTLAIIIVPAVWYGFLMISEYILKNTLQSAHDINAIFLNLPKILTLSLWEIRIIDAGICIIYPSLYKPSDMPDDQLSEIVTAQTQTTPMILNSIFMIEILKRQSIEDPHFHPYYTTLRNMYIYLWTIVVVRSILILF